MMKRLLYPLLLLAFIPLVSCDQANSSSDTASRVVQEQQVEEKKVETSVPAPVVFTREPVKEIDEQAFRANFAKFFPAMKLDVVKGTPVPGIVEVVIGAKVFYFSEDARYLMNGDMIDVATKFNITNTSLYKVRLEMVDAIGEKNMIVFSPEKPKYTVTIVTDIDCGYCRKMHSEMAEYNKLGIAVRYMFFPRAGINSDSYHKAVSVWCSADQKAALTQAKQGKNIERKTCDHPINNHMKLVKDMEITGTPALLFTSGNLILSYIPPRQLLEVLKKEG